MRRASDERINGEVFRFGKFHEVEGRRTRPGRVRFDPRAYCDRLRCGARLSRGKHQWGIELHRLEHRWSAGWFNLTNIFSFFIHMTVKFDRASRDSYVSMIHYFAGGPFIFNANIRSEQGKGQKAGPI